MRQSRAFVLFALFASIAAQDVPADAGSTAVAVEALASDEECSADYGAEGGGCALNALQLRAKRQQEEAEQRQTQQSDEHEVAKTEDDTPSDEELPMQNASLLENMFSASAKCFSYTGGSCATEHCAPYRHASCSYGKCVCKKGCAGADGKCYQQHNRLVAKGILLRNAKYSHYKMYFQRVSTFGQMKTTRASSWMNMNQDKFDIYEVPGSQGGHKEYFLASSKWPGYAVGFKATTGTALSPFAAYAVNLDKKGGVFDAWGPSNIMLRICETASGMLQVGAKLSDTKMIWAYVHHGSWYVYGSLSTPGYGGEWKTEPAVHSGTFPQCHR